LYFASGRTFSEKVSKVKQFQLNQEFKNSIVSVPMQDALEIFITNIVSTLQKYKGMPGSSVQAEAFFTETNGPEVFYVDLLDICRRFRG